MPSALSIVGTLIIMSSAIYTSVLPFSFLSPIVPAYAPIADKEDCLEANNQRDL